jgi:transposase
MPTDGIEMFSVTPTVIMDRGIATRNNIERIKERKLNYVVVERHQELDVFIDEFEGNREDFTEVKRKGRESVWVKLVPRPEDSG